MASQGNPAAAKRICNNAVRARLGIAALDGENALRMGQIPQFAAGTVFESGEHELSAHRAVADQAAFTDNFVQEYWHS